MNDLKARILGVCVYHEDGLPALHKPLILLYALGRLITADQRLISYLEIDAALQSLFQRFAPDTSARSNRHYPFGNLENDGIWEIQHGEQISRTSAGHLPRTELTDKGISGGFTPEVFSTLASDKTSAREIAASLATRYFPEPLSGEVLRAVGLGMTMHGADFDARRDRASSYSIAQNLPVPAPSRGEAMAPRENEFVAYLNSLHSLTANGANALAESQALSPYFGDLYEPFPLVESLKSLIAEGVERVVVLTGHAGDGKSTIALDVFKALRGVPADAPLGAPLKEREEILTPKGSVTIVKDMSELGAGARQEWLRQAFQETGSWLIVSNTGPLLQSLVDYADPAQRDATEGRLLSLLNRPVDDARLEPEVVEDFGKPLLILNLTRLDNVALGSRLLGRLVRHPGWTGCGGCPVEGACPLSLNRRALLETSEVAEERIRWIYRRINDYEQRLTLRQIVAQLAYGLTGGMGCAEARDMVGVSSAVDADRGTKGLEQILFSEGFFGFRAGKPRPESDALQAVALLRRSLIGGPVAPDFERAFAGDPGGGWAEIPDALQHIGALWQKRSGAPEGGTARASLRRMVLIFGRPRPHSLDRAGLFLDTVLGSPSLRELDGWQYLRRFTLSRSDERRLRFGCLDVLLEAYSGFSAGQFGDSRDQLHLTLRRPDRAVVQPTQLVVASIPFREFELTFDPASRLPKLVHRPSGVALELHLPLLDYIRRRDAGDLGNDLSPIHQTQLDRFQGELLEAATVQSNNPGEIVFLRAGIAGDVDVHHFYLSEDDRMLERD